MRSRTPALLAILLALGSGLIVTGCSEKIPPPTVDNTNVQPKKSVEATLGIETTITVDQLTKKLEGQGLKIADVPAKGTGLFNPSKFKPLTADGAYVQTYHFAKVGEARGAAASVDAAGYVLAATPNQLVNVNWTGWPAFFRSGDLIVIFVTEKGTKHAVRDKRVYEALTSILGSPFIGSNMPPPAALTSGSPSATGSPHATGTGE